MYWLIVNFLQFSQDLGNVLPLEKELIFSPLPSDQCVVDSTETIMLNDISKADEDKTDGKNLGIIIMQ